VTFECSSDVSNSLLQWYDSLCVTTSQNTSQCRNDLIYDDYDLANLTARFSVTSLSSSERVTRDLNINPTQLTDAGVYLCAELRLHVADITDSDSAQLVVLGNINI